MHVKHPTTYIFNEKISHPVQMYTLVKTISDIHPTLLTFAIKENNLLFQIIKFIDKSLMPPTRSGGYVWP